MQYDYIFLSKPYKILPLSKWYNKPKKLKIGGKIRKVSLGRRKNNILIKRERFLVLRPNQKKSMGLICSISNRSISRSYLPCRLEKLLLCS